MQGVVTVLSIVTWSKCGNTAINHNTSTDLVCIQHLLDDGVSAFPAIGIDLCLPLRNLLLKNREEQPKPERVRFRRQCLSQPKRKRLYSMQ